MPSTRAANPFRYRFLEPATKVPSILKLWFGKRYFVLKAKSPQQTATAVAMELDRRIRLGVAEDHIYYHVVLYINRARVNLFEIEVLLESEDALALLKREHQELKIAKNDEMNLNNYFDAYVPAWVPQATVKKFEAWKKTLNKKPVKKNAKAKPKDNKSVPARRGSGKDGSVPAGVRRGSAVGRKEKDSRTV